MTQSAIYDLLVVGAGPGGYVAAIRAAQLGLTAAIIEKDKVGGVCLNVGCIPSKALIHQAGIFSSIRELEHLGVKVDTESFDYGKVRAKVKKAADRLSKGVASLLKKNNVELIAGEAVNIRAGEVSLKDGTVVQGKKIIVATGSRSKSIPGFETDEDTVLTSTGALALESLPASILILGAGAIGVEFAHIMNAFGVDVHLVEMEPHILPLEDDETAEILAGSFKKRGIKMHVSTKALSQEKKNGKHDVLLDKNGKQETVTADLILVAVGRAPNTGSLGLEDAGIELDGGGFVKVGDYYETAVPGIYAIGDIVRTPLLAHVASAEGEIAVLHAAGKAEKKALDKLSIPAGTYSVPEVASFGLTERAAKDKGLAYKTLRFPYRGIGRAVASEAPDGLIKILIDEKTDETIGAHIVGAEATELIHELLLARSSELLPEDIIGMIHVHPTLSEGIMEAMRNARDGAIHV